jgi:hypothetical protein
VEESEGFARKIEDVREADFRLANRRLRPLGHLTVSKLLAILAIRQCLIQLCSSLCSSSPNLRASVQVVDGRFADHRLINDNIPTVALLRLLATMAIAAHRDLKAHGVQPRRAVDL